MAIGSCQMVEAAEATDPASLGQVGGTDTPTETTKHTSVETDAGP